MGSIFYFFFWQVSCSLLLGFILSLYFGRPSCMACKSIESLLLQGNEACLLQKFSPHPRYSSLLTPGNYV